MQTMMMISVLLSLVGGGAAGLAQTPPEARLAQVQTPQAGTVPAGTPLLASQLSGTPFSGTWKAANSEVPIAELTVKQDGGVVTGTAVFYMILHAPDGIHARVGGKVEGAMENVKADARTLTFDLHRRDGSLMSFRLEYRGDGRIRLLRTSDNTLAEQGDGLELIRNQ